MIACIIFLRFNGWRLSPDLIFDQIGDLVQRDCSTDNFYTVQHEPRSLDITIPKNRDSSGVFYLKDKIVYRFAKIL
jgi:hypothetical protein